MQPDGESGGQQAADSNGARQTPTAELSRIFRPDAERMSLAECLRIAEEKQPDLLTARAMLDSAAAQLRVQRAAYLPTVGASTYYIRQTYNYAAQPGDDPRQVTLFSNGQSSNTAPYYDVNLGVTQTIYDFGRTKGAVQHARAQLEATRQNLYRTRQTVDLNVRTAYFNVLAGEELVRIHQQDVRQQKQHLSQVEAFHDVGTRPKIDVTNQMVATTNSEVNLTQAIENLDVARATLATSMGIPIEQSPEPSDKLEAEQSTEAVETLLAEAARLRPDLLSAQQQIVSAQGDIIAARAAFKPNFTFAGFFDYRNLKFPLVYNWSLGLLLVENIFRGGADRAMLAEVTANDISAETAYQSALNNIRQQVYTAYSGVTVSKEQIGLAIQSTAAARENLRLAEGRYIVGYGNIIELTDAQTQATSAEAQEVNARLNYQTAAAQLQAAIGR